MHKLIERQLRKYFSDRLVTMMEDNSFSAFCGAVEQAYISYDNDRDLVERALDVSSRELNEKNEALQKARNISESANKAKSSFLANMSHEMRTPLNAIIGYSELLLEDLKDLNHEDIAVELDKIRTSGNHLLSLINNVLDLAKIESGHMDVNFEEFDLADLVRETCTILQSHAIKNKNELKFHIDSASSKVLSDRAKIKQILINLTGNALKFTRNGHVILRVYEPEPEKIAISFTDNGIGMSPEKLSRLFQPFVQGDFDTQKKFGGTGLGLSISAKFAELIGAGITVESKEGVGTTFVLTHKSLQGKANEKQQLVSHSAPNTGKDRDQRILLIDDDRNAIDLMRRFLGRHGFECVSLKSGTQAVEEAIRIQPTAILLDVFMPDMDGWTTLSQLKENEHTANIPVIFTTMTDERQLGLSLGAIDYFTKPIDWNRLASVLKSFSGKNDKRCMLLTDGDFSAKKSFLNFFEKNSWGVTEANESEAFNKKIAEERFDLIILDFHSKLDENLTCIKAIGASVLNHATPVLFCSNSSDESSHAELIKGRVKVVLTDDQRESNGIEDSIKAFLSRYVQRGKI